MNERLRAARAAKVRFTITSDVSDESRWMNALLRRSRPAQRRLRNPTEMDEAEESSAAPPESESEASES